MATAPLVRSSPAPGWPSSEGSPSQLVGRTADLGDLGDLAVLEASEVIEMHDDPAQGVRRKKDASVVRAAELVRDGKASAMVSAGNTGAAMVAALLRMGRIKGVSRPAIATTLPTPGRGDQPPTVLLDSGANAECHPEWLVQFAQMGTVYFRHRYGVAKPKVGLMSIGEESMKGNTPGEDHPRAARPAERGELRRQRRGA